MEIDRNGEILCALTMFFPSYQSVKAIVYIMATDMHVSIFDTLIIVQCFIHLPFSVILHVSRAYSNPCHFGKGLMF